MPSRRCLRALLICLSSAFLGLPVFAQAPETAGQRAELATRLRGARDAVVATVVDVRPYMYRNEFGDELIVSRLALQVHEVLRGQPPATVPLDVEGGTLNGFTLKVSDLPTLGRGDRAVFLLDRDSRGRTVPHWRGAGILPLDQNDAVRGSVLQLNDVRAVAGEVGR